MLGRDFWAATVVQVAGKDWHPTAYKEMKEAGTLNQIAQQTGHSIADSVQKMMGQGMREDEAEEVVRDELYPAPEKNQ